MSKRPLDYFGEVLMQKVRDEAIDDWDRIITGGMKSPRAQMVYNKIIEENPDSVELLKWIIPKIVDTTLHHLLCTLEQEEGIVIKVISDDEQVESIRDVSDGLAGELYTEDGWITRFSKQRYEE
jgi:hypothetical protein